MFSHCRGGCRPPLYLLLLQLAPLTFVVEGFRDEDHARSRAKRLSINELSAVQDTTRREAAAKALIELLDCPPWLNCIPGTAPAAASAEAAEEQEHPQNQHHQHRHHQHHAADASHTAVAARAVTSRKHSVDADEATPLAPARLHKVKQRGLWLPVPQKTKTRLALLQASLPDIEKELEQVKAEDFDPRRNKMAALIEACLLVILLVLLWRCCAGPRQERPVFTEGTAAAEGDAAAAGAASADAAAEDAEMQRLKKLKHRLLMEQAITKSKLEATIKEILELQQALEAANAGPELSAEEVKQQVAEATRAHELMTQRGLVTAVAYVAPFAMQGKRLAAALDSRLQSVREKAVDMVTEEVRALGRDVYDVLDLKDKGIFSFSQFGNIDLPAMALLIASAFAPTQLKLLHAQNSLAFKFKLLIVVLDGIVILLDKDAKCEAVWFSEDAPNDVMIWFYVDFFVAAFCCLVRFVVKRAVEATLSDIDRQPPPTPDNPIQAVQVLIEYYVSTGGEALIRLDTVTSSRLFGFVGWAMLFDFLWAMVGTDVVLNVPFRACQLLSIAVLRIRSLLFLVLVIPLLVALLIWLASKVAESDAVFIQLCKFANYVDNSLSLGFPLAKLLLQVCYVRNTYDMMRLELRVLRMDEDRVARDQQKLEKDLEQLKSAHASLQAEVEKVEGKLHEMDELGSSAEEEHERAKQKILEESEKFFFFVNDQSKKAADEAAKQVEEWEAGDGPEVLRALAKGEGGSLTQDYLTSLSASMQSAQESAYAAAAQLAESETLQNLSTQARQLADSKTVHGLAAQAGQLMESETVHGLAAQAGQLMESETVQGLATQAGQLMESETVHGLTDQARQLAQSQTVQDMSVSAAAAATQLQESAVAGAAAAASMTATAKADPAPPK